MNIFSKLKFGSYQKAENKDKSRTLTMKIIIHHYRLAESVNE